MTARTAIASTVPEPHGKPGGPGAFHIKGAMLPPYIEHVVGELQAKGIPDDKAYRLAIGIVRNWKDGHDGKGHAVSAEVQAAAAKAIAEYDALRARAKAIPNKGTNLSNAVPVGVSSKGRDIHKGDRVRVHAGPRKGRNVNVLDSAGVGEILAQPSAGAPPFRIPARNVHHLAPRTGGTMATPPVKAGGSTHAALFEKMLTRWPGMSPAKKKQTAPLMRAVARKAGQEKRLPKDLPAAAVAMSRPAGEPVDLATLTAKARKKLPPKAFAIPGKQAYPIHDPAHARAALSRVAQHGSPAEKAAVRRAVKRKFPKIGVASQSKSG